VTRGRDGASIGDSDGARDDASGTDDEWFCRSERRIAQECSMTISGAISLSASSASSILTPPWRALRFGLYKTCDNGFFDDPRRRSRRKSKNSGPGGLDAAITVALTAPDCLMVNRNAGSGTRILTDRFLDGAILRGKRSS
jgi:hypothetical protein